MVSLCSIMFCPGQVNVLAEEIAEQEEGIENFQTSTNIGRLRSNQLLFAVSVVALAGLTAIGALCFVAAITPELPFFVGYVGIAGLVAYATYSLRDDALNIQAAYQRAIGVKGAGSDDE